MPAQHRVSDGNAIMPDPNLRALHTLGRLRRSETDEARRDLAVALGREAQLIARDTEMAREIGAARDMNGDFDRETFSAWIVQVLAERRRVAAASREAAAVTASAQSALARRRVAATATESVIREAVLALEQEAARREQFVMEDAARALRQRAQERQKRIRNDRVG
jgi:hypothetical protein